MTEIFITYYAVFAKLEQNEPFPVAIGNSQNFINTQIPIFDPKKLVHNKMYLNAYFLRF